MNEEKLKELKKLDVLCCNNGSIILGIVTTEKMIHT
jgi:hypothetical protein